MINSHNNLHVTRRIRMEQRGPHYFSLAQTHLMIWNIGWETQNIMPNSTAHSNKFSVKVFKNYKSDLHIYLLTYLDLATENVLLFCWLRTINKNIRGSSQNEWRFTMTNFSNPLNLRWQRKVKCSNIRYWSPDNYVLFHKPPFRNTEDGVWCAISAIWINGPVSSENIS